MMIFIESAHCLLDKSINLLFIDLGLCAAKALCDAMPRLVGLGTCPG